MAVMAKNSRKNMVGFWLDVIPGLLGLFGIGELYLGRRLRGELFLLWTTALYVTVGFAFAYPNLSYYWGYLPIAWGAGYVLLLIDIFRITRNKSLKPTEPFSFSSQSIAQWTFILSLVNHPTRT